MNRINGKSKAPVSNMSSFISVCWELVNLDKFFLLFFSSPSWTVYANLFLERSQTYFQKYIQITKNSISFEIEISIWIFFFHVKSHLYSIFCSGWHLNHQFENQFESSLTILLLYQMFWSIFFRAFDCCLKKYNILLLNQMPANIIGWSHLMEHCQLLLYAAYLTTVK